MTQPELILPNLFRCVSRLRGTQQPVNTYLFQTDRRRVLVDPAADITPAVVGEVTDILVTHLQEENAAGCLNFPGARLHVPAGDEYLCHGPAEYAGFITPWPPPWEWETRGNYHGHIGGARNERPLPHPRALAESLQPSMAWGGCEIVATPGHGKHAVTIIASLNGLRVAFCGDLIHGDGQLWNWFDSEWDYGLETGQKSLLESAACLRDAGPDLLCPSHGPLVREPRAALEKLIARLQTVLEPVPAGVFDSVSTAVSDKPGRVDGFRELLPHLHQWTGNHGNCNVLLSDRGCALFVDDGLCQWIGLPERAAQHRQAIADLKQAFDLRRIEMVIPTHYHGDHVESIPELAALEGTEVVSLDIVADVLENPERFNLACRLPWYGTNHDMVKVDRRVASGTHLYWREYDLEIFHLGGQTYYHAGIQTTVDGRRVLFVGDSVGCFETDPPLCYNDCEPENRGWLYAARRMRERQPDLLVCGHGVALRMPGPMLRRKCALWERRLEQFRALAARPSLREFFDPFLGQTRGESIPEVAR